MSQIKVLLQVQNNGVAHKDGVPTAEIGILVQDALDAIEFIMGEPDTTWGSVRAKMGHPEPWNITKFGVGNEVSTQFMHCRHTGFVWRSLPAERHN